MIQDVLFALSMGSTNRQAARFGGIAEVTFYKYLNQGKEDAKNGKKSKAREFSEAVSLARSKAQIGWLGLINQAARGVTETKTKTKEVWDEKKKALVQVEREVTTSVKTDWKAAAWLLSRRYPEEWAAATRELNNDSDKLSPEQVMEAIKQATGRLRGSRSTTDDSS